MEVEIHFQVLKNKTMQTNTITQESFTRINNDVNGNPRYVIHFLDILSEEERDNLNVSDGYNLAVKKANKIGGRKYDTKKYSGGIVFQSYNLCKTIAYCLEIDKINN